jgi:hypothetical protein
MSFEILKKDELLEVADKFGVDVKPTDTKAVIIAALAEDGVSYEDAISYDENLVKQDEAEIKKDVSEDVPDQTQHLLRMTRANGTYEVRGYKFTSAHPFQLVSEYDAEWITENVDGFRYATPKEAKEFYG